MSELFRKSELFKSIPYQGFQGFGGDNNKTKAKTKDSNRTIPTRRRKAQEKLNPVNELRGLVQEHNAYIRGNKLADSLIDLQDYQNPNSPQYLDGSRFGINEEKNYVQNQLYRMQKSDKYIPDYEDWDNMNDEDFEDNLRRFTLTPDDVRPKNVKTRDKLNDLSNKKVKSIDDKMSDKKFINMMDSFIHN